VIGDPSTRELLALKRVSLDHRTTVKVQLPARNGAGQPLRTVSLYFMSDSYTGLDQQYSADLDLGGGGGTATAARLQWKPVAVVPEGSTAAATGPAGGTAAAAAATASGAASQQRQGRGGGRGGGRGPGGGSREGGSLNHEGSEAGWQDEPSCA
jgi:hypothetical protein